MQVKPFVEKLPDDYKFDFNEDSLIPKTKGFITDFIYSLRGYETPTDYCVWAAMGIVAAALKRNTFLEFAHDSIYPNLYIILVGPNGVVKKTTTISHALKVLESSFNFYVDKRAKIRHRIKVIANKCTPEAFQTLLLPGHVNKETGERINYIEEVDEHGKVIYDEKGEVKKTFIGSEAFVYVPELGTMLGKQKYNEGIIELLLDVYDCPNKKSAYTQGRKEETLRNVFITMMGAVTPTAVKESLPKTIMGDGYMSRTIMVYVTKTKRRFCIPKIYDGSPPVNELGARLAYIGLNCSGEYTIDKEAMDIYEKFYDAFKDKLEAGDALAGAKSRYDLHVLKIAMIIKAQSYATDRVITKEVMEDAIRIMESTYKMLPLLMLQTDDDDYWKDYMRFLYIVSSKTQAFQREDVLKITKFKAKKVTEFVNQAVQEGRISIVYQGREIPNSVEKGEEVYVWKSSEKYSEIEEIYRNYTRD